MTVIATQVERGVYVSALDLFSIGIGPSSSHTVGPMRAGADFVARLRGSGLLDSVTRFGCRLHGSLAATGIGHGTPDAVIAGLRGLAPETVDPRDVHGAWARAEAGEELSIGGVPLTAADIAFAPRERHHGHPNALTLTAFAGGRVLAEETYLSVGGGFIRRIGELDGPGEAGGTEPERARGSRYRTMDALLSERRGRSIAELAWEDEVHRHGAERAGGGDRRDLAGDARVRRAWPARRGRAAGAAARAAARREGVASARGIRRSCRDRRGAVGARDGGQ